ncbi:MAG: hypothetical protein WC773_00280 [Patescibacteria group bacterium]|jgi:hypothetical protein
MGRALVYTGKNRYRHGYRRRTVSKSAFIGPTTFRFVAIAALGVLLGLYVINTTRTTGNDAVIRDISQQKESLNNQLDALTAEEARNQTATETKKKAEGQGMVQGANQVQLASPTP